ncbi:uncharacterized protein A4U43_C04F2790 [Asparagus officinalis]|uniref:Protein kinase domain-containing protein n=1 Tax=Asparagus officinalis TaxID=4686 RepID=A0A5P1F2H4_ASPOF|nr:uncharacterized protein A4U43_C04F2790 [Asparagus officinalis]
MGRLKNLSVFRAGQNLISGSIPVEISECYNIRMLGLAQNNLGGEIPKEIGKLKYLSELILWDNQLSGVVPKELGNCTSLDTIALYQNNLVGGIPAEIGNLHSLQYLYIYRNGLNGTIPKELGNLSIALEIDFSENFLTGEIPAELSNIKGLRLLHLFQNKLTGFIPIELCELRNLTKLDLSINSLTGPIPVGLQYLPKLLQLQLFDNKLSGFIPPDIFSCRMLQRLDLSQNHFVGSVPVEIGTLLQLELLYLSDNKFLGMIPSILGKLSHLTELQMGGNQFSGAIPKELGGLSSLQIAMNLSYNNLSGEMPPELGNLALLEFLLLNNNHLTGEIPSTFENLSSLLGLNVSYNNLSGVLPAIPLFRNLALSSFAGNRGLCGGPLGSCNHPSISASPSLKRSGNPRGKIIAIVSAVIGDLVAATNNFDEGFVVGRGACGTVYRAVMHSGLVIAVKKLASNREGNNTDNSFLAEISTLGKIRHRNIVKLYGYCYHQGSNLLLYEYMSRGSLGELLHGEASSLDWNTRYMIALGAAEGLSYLHHDCKPHIIHRDIKSNNILLDEKFEAHVGDFGLAKVIDMSYSKSMSAVAGSYGYIAPEYAYTMKVTEKCDIYSYGVVLLELLTGRTPVQPLDVGGDLVTWVRNYIKNHSLDSGLFDSRLDLEDKIVVDHMITMLKIALLCTSMSPFDRPPMRQVVWMLIESKERAESFASSPASALSLRVNGDS